MRRISAACLILGGRILRKRRTAKQASHEELRAFAAPIIHDSDVVDTMLLRDVLRPADQAFDAYCVQDMEDIVGEVVD